MMTMKSMTQVMEVGSPCVTDQFNHRVSTDKIKNNVSSPTSRRVIFPTLYRSVCRVSHLDRPESKDVKISQPRGHHMFPEKPGSRQEQTPGKSSHIGQRGRLDSLLLLSPLATPTLNDDSRIRVPLEKPIRIPQFPVRPLPRPPLVTLRLPEVDEKHEDEKHEDAHSSSTKTNSSTSSTQASPRRVILLHRRPQPPTPEQTFRKPLKTPLMSILRTKGTPVKVTLPPNDNSVPSLVSLKDDDDEISSQSSTDVQAVEDTAQFRRNHSSSPPPPPPRYFGDGGSSNSSSRVRGVKFDPRVWVREFQRSEEESQIWYTVDDVERFKKHAIALIMARCSNETEIIPTGTGRMVKKPPSPACKAFFTHAALRFDADDDGLAEEAILEKETYRQAVMKNELLRVLVVDPHDICLTLFQKALETLLPHVQIVTARTGEEAMRHIFSTKRFDLILIEERLKLFHRQAKLGNSSSFRSAGEKCSEMFHSGSALIHALSQLDATNSSLLIGVSAHLDKDQAKLERSGADFCWAKPPPRMDQQLQNLILEKILIKRGKTAVAKELYCS